jgi:phosphohistidine phosphatase SixA
MRTLELRRHAKRDSQADRLSPEGIAQARALAKTLEKSYDLVFASAAARAQETADILAGRTDDVIEGLSSQTDTDALASVVRGIIDRIPEDGRALAVGHTPLIETAVLGLTGKTIEPLGTCEGVRIAEEGGNYAVDELRL